MSKVDIFKQVSSMVVSIGVSAIIGNTVRATTPAQVNTIKKVCIGVGGFVLTSMVSGAATKYSEAKIDDSVNSIKKAVKDGTLD